MRLRALSPLLLLPPPSSLLTLTWTRALASGTPGAPGVGPSCHHSVREQRSSIGSSISMSTSTSTGGSGGGYTYRYPRPSVTVDTLIFTADPSPSSKDGGDGVHLLLIRRKNPPFQGRFALPGGFVDPDEDLGAAAARELEEETGLQGAALAQVGAFGKPGRDPRGHTITVAYAAFVLLGKGARDGAVRAGDDAAEAAWFSLSKLPPLAFDHEEVIREAWRRLVVVVDEGGGAEGAGAKVVVERGSGQVLAALGAGAEGKRVAGLIEGTEPRVVE